MKQRILTFFLVVILALVMVVPAFADSPTDVQGAINPTGPDSGTLSGSFTGAYSIVAAMGQVQRLYFEGTLNGSTGTLLLTLVAVRPNGVGYWTVIESTGDFAGLHGQGTFAFPVETAGSYEGQVHIEP